MILSRIYNRKSGFSVMMIDQLSHNLFYVPVVNRKPIKRPNPSLVSLLARHFCSARHTCNPKVSAFGATQLSGSLLANRVTRTDITDAQDVLREYLHFTRNLSFPDADYISQNSPHFLLNLLSKIDLSTGVTRGLTKFLRYNPINEFEPFFESLGLSPSEVSASLPQNLIFLSDDDLLIENFHVLCQYGISRSKMGKMYKEAREIFHLNYGLLALTLEAYENLDLKRTTVIKLVTCCPSLLIGGVNDEFVKFLEKLNKLGIKSDGIQAFLSGNGSFNWKRMLHTLDFLAKVGYSEEQVLTLLKANSDLLFKGSGMEIYLWFGRLLKLGLKMNEVYLLFIQNPQILSRKCAKNLLRAVDFLIDIGMGPEDIAKIVSAHVELLCLSSLKGPKTVCRDLKVEKDSLCQMIREDPMKLFSLSSKSELKINGHAASTDERTKMEKTAFLLRLGYLDNSEEMMRATKKFRGRRDQLQERFDCLVNAGLDRDVVSEMVKEAPMVLNQSKDVIQKKIDCLINILGYPIESLASFPSYLCYNMERINQRLRMYTWARDRGAVKPMLSLSTILTPSEARFTRYFVEIHPEGPAMWESLKNTSTST